MGLVPLLVQKRLRSEDGMMGQSASAQDDGIGAGKAIFAYLDGLGFGFCSTSDDFGQENLVASCLSKSKSLPLGAATCFRSRTAK